MQTLYSCAESLLSLAQLVKQDILTPLWSHSIMNTLFLLTPLPSVHLSREK